MFFGIHRSIILAAFVSAFSASVATNAVADIIQIPAIAFTQRASSVVPGVANFGTLTTAEGKYYAAVPFTVSGQRVCRFTLVHRDNDADSGITARLFKKRILVGSNPFESPVQMAVVVTGVMAGTQFVATKSDDTIAQSVINLSNAFYYVELEFGSDLLEALGVQIEVAATCP